MNIPSKRKMEEKKMKEEKIRVGQKVDGSTKIILKKENLVSIHYCTPSTSWHLILPADGITEVGYSS
jgi:hypothetical protein